MPCCWVPLLPALWNPEDLASTELEHGRISLIMLTEEVLEILEVDRFWQGHATSKPVLEKCRSAFVVDGLAERPMLVDHCQVLP